MLHRGEKSKLLPFQIKNVLYRNTYIKRNIELSASVSVSLYSANHSNVCDVVKQVTCLKTEWTLASFHPYLCISIYAF